MTRCDAEAEGENTGSGVADLAEIRAADGFSFAISAVVKVNRHEALPFLPGFTLWASTVLPFLP